MHSAIYEGDVLHRRTAETAHSFKYRVAMHYLDLDEVASVLDGRLTRKGFGTLRFRPTDFMTADAARALAGTDGPVRLLTHLRSLGHCFNPVSFYFCFREDESLGAIVAEVTNTPWGERHAYVLPRNSGGEMAGSFAKQLHVSPFFGMQQTYRWYADTPGEHLQVALSNWEGPTQVFEAAIRLERRAFDAPTVRRTLWRYPFASRRILVLIYAHAVALRLKGVRFKRHPGAVTP
jgi:DUF1365 family protein